MLFRIYTDVNRQTETFDLFWFILTRFYRVAQRIFFNNNNKNILMISDN